MSACASIVPPLPPPPSLPFPPSPSPSSLPVPHCTLISCTHPPLPLPPILALVLRRRRLFACSRMAFMPLIFIHVVVVLPLWARIDCSCSFSCRSLRLSAVSTPCFFPFPLCSFSIFTFPLLCHILLVTISPLCRRWFPFGMKKKFTSHFVVVFCFLGYMGVCTSQNGYHRQ
ncbi:hypothetical protein K457DRAFT_389336 [Linnemannia elongata AG-77]|uniref:Uncharacterized protein n=1 Tax=Linnemannia elongata AG-77 TaxID=1314771 RepID=A0A197K214_9FUNG|nr:hypothetical protein K457DRAFT_389336 [Linnemannia elongata AG-77]